MPDDPYDQFDQASTAEADPYTQFDEPSPMPHTSAALAQVPDETIPATTEAEGGARRQVAARIAQDVRPTMPEWSPQSIAFDAMTGIPDLLVGLGGTIAGGPAVGLGAMMASIAPEEWSQAKNEGLDDRKAATYATLSTLAQGAPE